MSSCTNSDKNLRMEIISRIQEENRRKKLKDQTSEELDSLTIGVRDCISTETMVPTNHAYIVNYTEKKVEIDKIVVKGLLSVGVQLSVLRNEHLCGAFSKISEYGRKYSPPSNETGRTKFLNRLKKT